MVDGNTRMPFELEQSVRIEVPPDVYDTAAEIAKSESESVRQVLLERTVFDIEWDVADGSD